MTESKTASPVSIQSDDNILSQEQQMSLGTWKNKFDFETSSESSVQPLINLQKISFCSMHKSSYGTLLAPTKKCMKFFPFDENQLDSKSQPSVLDPPSRLIRQRSTNIFTNTEEEDQSSPDPINPKYLEFGKSPLFRGLLSKSQSPLILEQNQESSEISKKKNLFKSPCQSKSPLSRGTSLKLFRRNSEKSPSQLLQFEDSSQSGTSNLLPRIDSPRASNIPMISAKTLVDYCINADGKCEREVIIIDCRFNYEYQGGHIKGAISINTPQTLQQIFFSDPELLLRKGYINDLKKDLNGVLSQQKEDCESLQMRYKSEPLLPHSPMIIFYCEFSIERGPRMFNYLRRLDREFNEHDYPTLTYPETYLLSGGYSNFVSEYKDLCTPIGSYTPMLDPLYNEELFQAQSESRQLWKNKPKPYSNNEPTLPENY